MNRPDPIADALDETGTTLHKGAPEGTAFRPRASHSNPQTISERYAAACARCDRILAGIRGSSDFEQAVKNAECPGLAKELAALYMNYLTYTAPAPIRGVDPNPFRGLSDRDAARKYMRMIEDIADRSTGRMGPWYTGVRETLRGRR